MRAFTATTRTAVAVLAIAALGLSACGSDDDDNGSASGPATTAPAAGPADVSVPEPGPGDGDQIVIKTFIFRPNPLEVPAGTTVTWTNLDEILHTVTAGERGSPESRFDAELDDVGSTFTHTFDEPGTFAYHCTIHPGMDATVEVV